MMVIASPNPYTPYAITAGSAKAFSAGNAPECSGIGHIQMKPGSSRADLIAFMQIGNGRLMAPVRENNGTLPGALRCTVGAEAATLHITFFNPASTQLAVHIRDISNNWSTTTTNTNPWDPTHTVSLPVGTTAFAIGVTRASGTVRWTDDVDSDVHFTLAPANGTTFTFGNHAEHMILKATPHLVDYSISRAKALGAKLLWSYRDAKIYGAGNIITAQFPPGTFHTQYDGDNVFEQVKSARLKHVYNGDAVKGACNVFCPVSIDSLILSAPTQTFANSGYMVLWTNASAEGGNAAKAEFQFWHSFEYTTGSLVPINTRPPACDIGTLGLALSMMASMPLCSENPHHELINAAWSWFKKNAVRVLTSKKTYYTLGDIIGTAALAL